MLQVSVLGGQVISDRGTGGVRARSSRAAALVGFLAVHAGSPQSRQRIAGLFWPDSADAQALTNLRRELHYLRQVLGDEPSLVVTSRDLCWRDSATCRVDVRVFAVEREGALAAAGDGERVVARASAAVAVYGGDFLAGLYDDWLLEARSALERQCVDLCDLICATRARMGDLAGAVDAARRRIRLQPLEEVGYRTLMRLQADLGDRAGAMSAYHHCASVLERELGVVPDPATRQALRRVLARVEPAGAGGAGRGGGGRAVRVRRGAAGGPVRGAGAAGGPVAGRGGGPRRPGAGPRGRRGREDPAGGRGRRAGAVAGRGGGHGAVLRHIGFWHVGAAGAGPGGRLAAEPGGAGGDGGARSGLAGRGGPAGARGRGPRRSGLAGRGGRGLRPRAEAAAIRAGGPGWTGWGPRAGAAAIRAGGPRCWGPRAGAAACRGRPRAMIDAWQRHLFLRGWRGR